MPVRKILAFCFHSSTRNGKYWEQLTEAERRTYPGDYEAQVSQGAIAHHPEEFLATTDLGIVLLRRLLQKQLKAVAEGRDPAGVSFDPAAPPVKYSAGNFLVASECAFSPGCLRTQPVPACGCVPPTPRRRRRPPWPPAG